MSGLTGYEKLVLGLTAAFLLFTGGWFLHGWSAAQPYEVRVDRAASSQLAAPAEEGEEGETAARPDSLLEGEVIDLNTAGVYDLQRLPGIGEKRAQDIVAYREEHGPFGTVDELDNVSGIGPGILEGLREYASVGVEEESGE